MTGGLLQLVAKTPEDIYLTTDPTITFFKTVYRRHTNMSKSEIDLYFTNKLDFGKESECRIETYGDLVHRLYLNVKLPRIEAIYRFLTIMEVQGILKSYDIVWETSKEPVDRFTQSDYDEIVILINQKVDDLNMELGIINNILATLDVNTGVLAPNNWIPGHPGATVDSYYQDMISNLAYGYIRYDQYDLIYKTINADLLDIVKLLPLSNSPEIQTSMWNFFIDYAVSYSNVTFNDDNLRFMYNVDSANYNISGSVDTININTVFRTAIDSIYTGDLFYKLLDAYHIFDNILKTTDASVSGNSDINNVKLVLISNIRFNLIQNIQYLLNIYNSLDIIAQFIFYRKFILLAPNVYSTDSSFINNSTIINPSTDLNDNFTTNFAFNSSSLPASTQFLLFNTIDVPVTNFNTNNTLLFKQDLINTYFNDILNLWKRINIITLNTLLGIVPPVTVGFNMYFLNYLWFIMNIDIRQVLIANGGDQTALTLIHDEIYLNIVTKLTQPQNYSLANTLNNTKTNKFNGGDIVLFCAIRMGIMNSLVEYAGTMYTIPDYITKRYKDYTATLSPVQQELFNKIIDLFNTDIANIPSYTTYIAQNYNIYSNFQINSATTKYYDVQCSIWNYLFRTFVANYNLLFNSVVLNTDLYHDTIGLEIYNYVLDIALNLLNIPNTSLNNYDYYLNVDSYFKKLPVYLDDQSPGDGAIGTYINNKINALNAQFVVYDANRGLLNMKDIILQKSKYYYNRFQKTVNDLTFIIETTMNNAVNPPVLLYDHFPHGGPNDIVLIEQFNLSELNPNFNIIKFIEPRYDAIDIVDIINVNVREFINTLDDPTYPGIGPNKQVLWDLYNHQVDIGEQLALYNNLFGWLINEFTPDSLLTRSQKLFAFFAQITILYNNFGREDYVYQFMKDYVVQHSILKDLAGLLTDTIEGTYRQIYLYYINKKLVDEDLLNRINGTGQYTQSLESILLVGLNGGKPANFAWIRKIGHYLINQIWIEIDGQIIDTQYGEWLEVWHSLSRSLQTEKGYDRLIGNIPELTTFNKEVKNQTELMIPLQFWFNRYVGCALPIVGLNNCTVSIHVKLKTLDEVSYRDMLSVFKRVPRLDCSILAEYIYVDTDERHTLATSKLEYFVDNVQYNGNMLVTASSIDPTGHVDIVTRFKNSAKEFIWMLQDVSHVDGSLPNGERQWDQYGFVYVDGDGIERVINPIDQAKIRFNHRDREAYKDIIFYNYIQPYERHSASPSVGINVYSYSLNPESGQPTGTANMTRIDDCGINFSLSGPAFDAMASTVNPVSFRMPIYALTMNILRICSGLAGLLYQQ